MRGDVATRAREAPPANEGSPESASGVRRSSPSRAAARLASRGAPVGPLSPAAPAATPETRGLVVPDDAVAGPGQMRRTEFLEAARAAVCAAAVEILGADIAGDCPQLDRWFGYYATVEAGRIERTVARYAPETAGATSAAGYVSAIVARVRHSLVVWAATRRITGIPSELAAVEAAGAEAGPSLLARREAGARRGPATAAPTLIARGTPLEAGVRARMEAAFGLSFAQVRVHADREAAQLADGLDARAFAVGDDVGFASGEYRPGSLAGDALIAHELAHTVQQRGGGGGAGRPHEADAQAAAATALAGARAKVGEASRLSLQRCNRREPPLSETLAALTNARSLAGALRNASDPDLAALPAPPAGSLLQTGLRWERAFRGSRWGELRALAEADTRASDDDGAFWPEYGLRLAERIADGPTTIVVSGDASFASWVRRQLMQLVTYRAGSRLLLSLLETGQRIELRSGADFQTEATGGDEAGRFSRDRSGPGTRTGSTVTLNPAAPPQVTLGRASAGGAVEVIDEPEVPVFAHELIHALHNARGENIRPTAGELVGRRLGVPAGLVAVPETGEVEDPEELRTIRGQTAFAPPGGWGPGTSRQVSWPLSYPLPPGITENDLRREAGLPERISHSGQARHVVVTVRPGETIDQLAARYSLPTGAVPAPVIAEILAVLREWYPSLVANGVPQSLASLPLPTGNYISLRFLARRSNDLADTAAKLRVR